MMLGNLVINNFVDVWFIVFFEWDVNEIKLRYFVVMIILSGNWFVVYFECSEEKGCCYKYIWV